MPNTDNMDIREIGEIDNYYGCLSVKEEGSKYYWAIENHDGFRWEEIPDYLYNTLNRFEDSKSKEYTF